MTGAATASGAYDRVTARLAERTGGTGRGGMWPCPAHDDHTPSLSVRPGDGTVLIHCHAGCPTDTVLANIGLAMADLYDTPKTNGSDGIVATYDYTDEHGTLLYQVVRKTGKRFVQRRPGSNGEWIWNLGDTRRVLYHLPQVLEAVANGDPVLIVEGEKDADRAAAEGYTATTCPHGAGKWRSDYNHYLDNANVTIVADRDKPGRDHARDIARALNGHAATTRIVEPVAGKDLTDHLIAGLTIDQLARVRPENDPATQTDNGRHVDLTPAASIRPLRVRWTWDNRIATGTIALLAGPEGLGKSTVAYSLAAQLSRGTLEGEHYGTPKGVLICATEDSWAHTIVPRLMAHNADLNRVYRVQVKDTEDIDQGLSLPADLDQLSINARRVDAAILILDPLMSRLHDSLDTHRDGDVRKALEPLADMAEKTGMAILGIIHHNKSGSTDPLQLVMASKAFAAVARSVHTVIRDPDDDTQNQKLFGTSKNNLGTMDLPTLTFTIQPWTYPTDDGDGTTGQILWGAQRQESIGEALARTVKDPDEKSALDEAVEWLADYLGDTGGRAEAGLTQAAARAAGIAERTLRRARAKLGVDKRKTGFQGTWEWFLADEAAEAAKSPQDPDLGPLAPLDRESSPRGQDIQRGQRCVSPGDLAASPGRFDGVLSTPASSRSELFGSPPAGTPSDDCHVCHAPHHPTTFHRCQCPTCTQENTP